MKKVNFEIFLSQLEGFEININDIGGAIFSVDQRKRFLLWRYWDENKPMVLFIGLNPSTAGHAQDDRTTKRMRSFASNWGFGGYALANCFPYISTQPRNIKTEGHRKNTILLDHLAKLSPTTIFCWGNTKKVYEMRRNELMIRIFQNPFAIALNQNNTPKHPLYAKLTKHPMLYEL